jgi:hypothetical protein
LWPGFFASLPDQLVRGKLDTGGNVLASTTNSTGLSCPMKRMQGFAQQTAMGTRRE